jgi:hypothetical protein
VFGVRCEALKFILHIKELEFTVSSSRCLSGCFLYVFTGLFATPVGPTLLDDFEPSKEELDKTINAFAKLNAAYCPGAMPGDCKHGFIFDPSAGDDDIARMPEFEFRRLGCKTPTIRRPFFCRSEGGSKLLALKKP